VTELLLAWSAGEPRALERLMPLVYDELHSIAAGYLRRERAGHTLQATAVIHEAYLRMVDKTHPHWHGRVHFFAVAATVMRRVLVDHARARDAVKRGGGAPERSLSERVDAPLASAPEAGLLDLDRALDALAAFDARKARVVELRYFGGLDLEETARVLGVSSATVRLDTRLARAWLRRELERAGRQA
jgi:RNA polymerase sigma factor (TIGR02999 family)